MRKEESFIEIIQSYTNWEEVEPAKLWTNTLDTLYMTFASLVAVLILGLILGLILYETNKREGKVAKAIYYITTLLVNVFRSIPFIILIVLLIPFTRALLDTMTGPTAGLPALILSAAPFYGRLVETSFRDVDRGVIEAAEAMGASKLEIITKVLIPESLPSLISGITVTAISLIGFSAIAGIIGAGGLGNMAYLDGFQRSRNTVTLVATVTIVAIVFVLQATGDFIVKKIDKR
ncbi:methionine ABC transporter permease [Marinilactibacillus sp. 15R]|uniref:D-methionine transport system permease protein n=1 Tax=Marinilactibacillus piezotolerans TaxID=258723 RepID=A0A1I4A1C0_9LACT|nr:MULTISPECIES: methionine ABC transporter permease [Marinilactibacillus]API90148.1 methionine ABC transporter permease [Marinilactibacillus sp. 15R]SFK50174.1 D-methionine transport system permease protein [Marinilactibacillus piezotolerans]